jgi:hypothetical protein
MAVASPVVRYLIVCEDIQTEAEHPRKVTLVNLISTIHSKDEPPFPLLYRELCVFVQLTECRGRGEVSITILHESSGQITYPGPITPWSASLPNDPLEVVGLRFRIRNIEFKERGLVQFGYNGGKLAEQPLLLR